MHSKMSQRIWNIAHRGARAHAPENTLAAARLAHALGADMWETDVALSSDGQPVILHDDTLERTTDISLRCDCAGRTPWRLEDHTLTELRSLDAGAWFGQNDPFGTIAAGQVTPAQLAAFSGEQIPTLEEALLLTKQLNWRINIEIKDHSARSGFAGRGAHERVTGLVAALIRKHAMQGAVWLSSFQHDYLREAANLLPDVPRGALVEAYPPDTPQEYDANVNHCGAAPSLHGPDKAQHANWSGQDFSDQDAAAYEGSTPRDLMSVDAALAMYREAKADFFHPPLALASARFVAAMQDAGYPVNVWTVNTRQDLRCMQVCGVHGIITDFPGRLRSMQAE